MKMVSSCELENARAVIQSFDSMMRSPHNLPEKDGTGRIKIGGVGGMGVTLPVSYAQNAMTKLLDCPNGREALLDLLQRHTPTNAVFTSPQEVAFTAMALAAAGAAGGAEATSAAAVQTGLLALVAPATRANGQEKIHIQSGCIMQHPSLAELVLNHSHVLSPSLTLSEILDAGTQSRCGLNTGTIRQCYFSITNLSFFHHTYTHVHISHRTTWGERYWHGRA